LKGIKPPPLGSLQDYILQKYMLEEEEREIIKIRLLSLSSYKVDADKKFNIMVDKLWKDYMNGKVEPEHLEKEEVIKFYQDVVKKSRPKLTKGKDGFVVFDLGL